MVKLSFPGLGIEEFSVNPVAFTVPIFGGIEVRWYGLIITLGIILAFTYCAYRSKQAGISFDDERIILGDIERDALFGALKIHRIHHYKFIEHL